MERRTTSIELREPRIEDAAAYLRLLARLPTDTPNFLFGYTPDLSIAAYVTRLQSMKHARNLPKGWVPATFLFAFDTTTNEIVGRASIRHALNEQLAREGGHIGYAVLPKFRNQGIATQILRLALDTARMQLNIEDPLVTCDETNTASRRVIEKNGGIYEGKVDMPNGPPKLHFRFGAKTVPAM